MQSDIIKSNKLSVTMLNAIMLNVVEPYRQKQKRKKERKRKKVGQIILERKERENENT